jgi:hypothetical protein
MKRAHEQSRSMPKLPVANAFPMGTPLHETLHKCLVKERQQSMASLKQEKPPPSANSNISKPFLPETCSTPENTELFAYTNALLYRVTGRYLPTSVISDGVSQAEEVAHIQSDPELLVVVFIFVHLCIASCERQTNYDIL